jgi:hypothetical protein
LTPPIIPDKRNLSLEQFEGIDLNLESSKDFLNDNDESDDNDDNDGDREAVTFANFEYSRV